MTTPKAAIDPPTAASSEHTLTRTNRASGAVISRQVRRPEGPGRPREEPLATNWGRAMSQQIRQGRLVSGYNGEVKVG